MKLNAIELLYLHFVNGRTHDEAIMYDFWFTQYSSKAEDLIESLLNKEIIYKYDDLSVTLKKLKVPQLKDLLKHSGIKVSGNKGTLIERILKNRPVIDIKSENLKHVYTVKDEFEPLLMQTKFINYFHFNGHISIFEVYDYYLKHSYKTSDEIAIGVLEERIETHIDQQNKYDVLKSFQLLSHFYLEEKNDLGHSIYYLNNFTMIIILQSILSYPENKKTMSGSLFNIDNFTAEKYRVLLDTHQLKLYDFYHALVNDTGRLPYPYEQRKKAARFIVDYVMEDEDAEIKLRSLLDDSE